VDTETILGSILASADTTVMNKKHIIEKRPNWLYILKRKKNFLHDSKAYECVKTTLPLPLMAS
jgi:hypothetical protein